MSRLAPTGEGDLPTKVVIHGTTPGSAESQLLAKRLGGDIRHVQNSARQARETADSPTQHMVKDLPNGRGRVTYSYNQGVETLHVFVEPSYREELLSQPEEKHPGRADPTLAIDILFTNELFTAYDIVTLTSENITPGGTYPDQPEFWDVQVIQEIGPALAPWRESRFVTDYQEGTVRIEFYNQKGPVVWYDDLFQPRLGTKFDFGPIEFYHIYAWCKYSDGGGGNSQVVLLEVGDRQPGTPGGSYPPTVTRLYGKEQRDYFDVLIPAGAVGDPDGDEPYQAEALGRTGNHEDDRLIPCAEMPITLSCAREFTVDVGPSTTTEDGTFAGDVTADAPPFWVGQGFLAQPAKTQIAGVPIEKTVIDIYLAASNNTETNEFPGTAHRFNVVKRELKGDIKVRVREFADTTPVGVRVDVTTQMVRRTYHSPPNQEPYLFDLQVGVPSAPPHTGTWAFAASKDWSDGGNEPAEPDRKTSDGKDMMGKLLDERTFSWGGENIIQVAPIDPVPNQLLHEPIWPGKVIDGAERMTFLCRIEWTPPEEVYLKGTAQIL